MAITADFSGSKVIKSAYIKIERIWGSKKEGWNAFVGVYSRKINTVPDEIFNIHADFVDYVNPFSILYEKIGKLSILNNVKHDDPVKKSTTKN